MNSKKKLNITEYLKKRSVKRFSIFIAIAFVFLIFSKLSNDYKQTIKLKVSLTNIEDEIILENDSTNIIEAYIEAKGFALVPFIFKNSKTLVLNASNDLVTRERQYIFDVQKHKFIIDEQLGSSYKVLSIKPDTLVIPYSKRASKNVPVVLKPNINFAAGYDILNHYELSVDSVKIIGSVEQLEQLNSISTKELILKEVNYNIDKTIAFDVPEKVEVFPKSLNVRAEVRRFTEGTIEAPITIVNKPESIEINYFPKTVTVSYYVDLDNYNAIKVSDFRVECDYASIKENQPFFIPKITKKPDFVKRVVMKQKRIDFIKL